MKLDLFEILREFPETTLTVHAGDLGHFARELLAEDFVQVFDRARRCFRKAREMVTTPVRRRCRKM